MADPVGRLLAEFARRQPVRTGSLIITIFGDAILPRGGEVQAADLIALLAAFSLKDGQARTALSRLVAEGWLAAERRGRNSLYRLSETGRHRFDEATRRIYRGTGETWRGDWHLAILPPGKVSRRDELRKDLGWLGFGTLAGGVMLHPAPDRRSLASVIADLPERERPLVISGRAALPVPAPLLGELVAHCWDLDALARSYRQFLAQFAPLGRSLERGFAPAPLPALLARLMLIHDYRRSILRDPLLPPKLRPGDWAGREAHAAARRIYRALVAPAERWIDAHLRAGGKPLPAPGAAFRRRFA